MTWSPGGLARDGGVRGRPEAAPTRGPWAGDPADPQLGALPQGGAGGPLATPAAGCPAHHEVDEGLAPTVDAGQEGGSGKKADSLARQVQAQGPAEEAGEAADEQQGPGPARRPAARRWREEQHATQTRRDQAGRTGPRRPGPAARRRWPRGSAGRPVGACSRAAGRRRRRSAARPAGPGPS